MADVAVDDPRQQRQNRRENPDEDDSEEMRRLRRRQREEEEEEVERMMRMMQSDDDDEGNNGADERELLLGGGDDDDGGGPLVPPEDQQDGEDDADAPPAGIDDRQHPPPAAAGVATLGRRFTYVESSFYAAAGLLYYAFRTRQQWYLAMVFLSSSKLSLVVFGNALVALAIFAFDRMTSIFLNGLRLQEAEGLQDYFRWNVTETCLALTMFRSELQLRTAIEFLALIWIKCAHQVAVLRENHVRMTQEAIEPYELFGAGAVPIPTIPYSHLKLWSMLIGLQFVDLWIIQYTGQDLMSDGPSVNILFCFEAAILLISAWSHLLLQYLHSVDGLLHFGHDQFHDNRVITRWLHYWKEYKATLTFAVELQAQAIQFIFYLSFFAIVLTYYGMPINLFREVYMSFVQLKERLVAFTKYRRLMASMNRFESATEEQLEESQDDLQRTVCIICRDDMHVVEDIKILPVCNHLFHKSCLREWLVQQQSCPTCRSDIAAMEAQEEARIAANAAAEARQQQQQDREGEQPQQQTDEVQGVGEAGDTEASATQELDDGQQQQPQVPVRRASPTAGRSLATIRRLREERDRRVREQQQQQQASPAYSSSPPQIIGETRTTKKKAVRFTETFPALYRVVPGSGARVLDDDGLLIRTVAPGRVVLCHGMQEEHVLSGGRVTVLLLPDGWVAEDSVERVCAVP